MFHTPDERGVAPALAVARRCGLIAGTAAEEMPAGKGRPEGWVPQPRM